MKFRSKVRVETYTIDRSLVPLEKQGGGFRVLRSLPEKIQHFKKQAKLALFDYRVNSALLTSLNITRALHMVLLDYLGFGKVIYVQKNLNKYIK